MGTRATAVTELTETSSGEKADRATVSQKSVTIAPRRNETGIITRGFIVLVRSLARCGTAIPTKDTGPAKAVTTADSRLEKIMRKKRSNLIFTPTLFA